MSLNKNKKASSPEGCRCLSCQSPNAVLNAFHVLFLKRAVLRLKNFWISRRIGKLVSVGSPWVPNVGIKELVLLATRFYPAVLNAVSF